MLHLWVADRILCAKGTTLGSFVDPSPIAPTLLAVQSSGVLPASPPVAGLKPLAQAIGVIQLHLEPSIEAEVGLARQWMTRIRASIGVGEEISGKKLAVAVVEALARSRDALAAAKSFDLFEDKDGVLDRLNGAPKGVQGMVDNAGRALDARHLPDRIRAVVGLDRAKMAALDALLADAARAVDETSGEVTSRVDILREESGDDDFGIAEALMKKLHSALDEIGTEEP
jgi:hypothetical protein